MFDEVLMGTLENSWMHDKHIKYITFSVTDECNLRCTYCYFTHKTSHHRMSFDVAKKAIDNILDDERMDVYDGVVWEFIGGEPTLELDLIDKICDYILISMYSKKHKWFYNYRFMIGTNGLLYASDKFQKIIKKHQPNIHVAITIDGNQQKHDLSRKKVDGSGSYEDIKKIVPLWLDQIKSHSTKATFSSPDLPYLKDSIVSLWELGITKVMANVVFEDVWKDGDDLIFENELKKLADYIIENKLWDKFSVRFFSQRMGYPRSDASMRSNMCGSGTMLAIDYKGDYYPCVRFLDSALNNYSGKKIGNVNTGVDSNKVRAFYSLNGYALSSGECIDCPISSECGWCTGLNYDNSSVGTIFEKATHICKMHKANVRADIYFWNKYEEATKKMSPRRYNQYRNISSTQRYLYIICDDNTGSFCHYNHKKTFPTQMGYDVLEKAVDFCETNYYTPIFIGSANTHAHYGFHINSLAYCYPNNEFYSNVASVTEILNHSSDRLCDFVYLTVDTQEIDLIEKAFIKLISYSNIKKIKIIITDYSQITIDWIIKYKNSLAALNQYLLSLWKQGRYLQIDVITDALYKDSKNRCFAGKYNFTLSPAGDFYVCPGFYYENNPLGLVGNLGTGIISKYENLLQNNKFVMCQECNAISCAQCIYQNKLSTDEMTVSSEEQCLIANIELDASIEFIELLKTQNLTLPFAINWKVQASKSHDPILSMRGENIITKNLSKMIKKYEKN